MKGFPRAAGWFLPLLFVGMAGAADTAQERPQSAPATQTAPAAEDTGTLSLQISGNRKFCVSHNEVDFEHGTVKPRQQRNSPLITTLGYKYQISASRRGAGSIIKLMESPTIRTTYMERQIPDAKPPQPRLTTPTDKKTSSQPLKQTKKLPRWVPGSGCTTLLPEHTFPLAPGRYDIYLGFDVLLFNGQWAPMQSDFVTDVLIEKGRVTRVNGLVDYTDGVRTVKLESPEKPPPAGK